MSVPGLLQAAKSWGCFTGRCEKKSTTNPATTHFASINLLPLIPFSAKLSRAFSLEQQVKFPLCEHKAMKPPENNDNKTKKNLSKKKKSLPALFRPGITVSVPIHAR